MHQSPLHKYHVEHGAKMVDFAGWEMPLYYSGIIDEHQQVRNSGGMFDVSHMGRVKVSGRHARRLLEKLCTRRVSDMQEGQCRYSLVLNEQGGVKDDVLVYRQGDDQFLVVVNASNREKLVEHFEQVRAASEFKADIDDQTLKTAMVAMQGPRVMELISGISREVPSLKRYRFTVKNLMVAKLLVSRTGYTGEDGVEVILPANMVGLAMKLLMKDVDVTSGESLVKPAGLGARDTLRLEAGMALYGNELSEDIDALATGLGFAMNLDKDGDERGEAFIGLDALRRIESEGGPKKKLIGLTFDSKRSPRHGMPIKAGGTVVGEVTSGAMSPTLGRPIAMGYVETERAENGTTLVVDGGKHELEGTVVPIPFYKAPKPQQPAKV